MNIKFDFNIRNSRPLFLLPHEGDLLTQEMEDIVNNLLTSNVLVDNCYGTIKKDVYTMEISGFCVITDTIEIEKKNKMSFFF